MVCSSFTGLLVCNASAKVVHVVQAPRVNRLGMPLWGTGDAFLQGRDFLQAAG
jgi:hypothetical protein